jgi:sodium pump decarboxylase gamma subunit
MVPVQILAVATKTTVSVMDALPHLAGMLMVMITLTILWGVCAFTAKLIQILMPPPAKSAPAPAAKAPPAAATADSIPPEIVAVIAAAVSSTVGKQIRIVSIKPHSSGWEKAGRQSVLSSHRIR